MKYGKLMLQNIRVEKSGKSKRLYANVGQKTCNGASRTKGCIRADSSRRRCYSGEGASAYRSGMICFI